MLKRIGQFLAGITVLILLILGFQFAISLNIFKSEAIIRYISVSSSPRISLLMVSALIVSSLVTLFKFGVNLEFLKKYIDPEHPTFKYLFDLILWATIPIIFVSSISLTILQPECQSPTAIIDVKSQGGEKPQFDGKTVTAKAGSTLTLEATSTDNMVIFCSWSGTGQAVRSITPGSSCKTLLALSDDPGRGIISLSITTSICPVKSTEPLVIITNP
jgi:hypothetical protein